MDFGHNYVCIVHTLHVAAVRLSDILCDRLAAPRNGFL